MRITEALTVFLRQRNIKHLNGDCRDINDFFRPVKGDAKRVRKTLDSQSNLRPFTGIRPVITFINLTGINLGQCTLNSQYGSWNWHFLPNKLREFLFKFFNNQLGINTRLSHFVPNVTRFCTFCTVRGVVNPPDETFSHLFFDCPHTSQVHRWFINNHFQGIVLNNAGKRNLFFTGSECNSIYFNPFLFITVMSIQFLLWESKIQKRCLSPLTLDLDFRFLVKNYMRNTGKLRNGKICLQNAGIGLWLWAS
jgi:hypothetical protein